MSVYFLVFKRDTIFMQHSRLKDRRILKKPIKLVQCLLMMVEKVR